MSEKSQNILTHTKIYEKLFTFGGGRYTDGRSQVLIMIHKDNY